MVLCWTSHGKDPVREELTGGMWGAAAGSRIDAVELGGRCRRKDTELSLRNPVRISSLGLSMIELRRRGGFAGRREAGASEWIWLKWLWPAASV